MTGEQTRTPPDERQKMIILETRKAAKARGLDWKTMAKDDRKKLKDSIRQDLTTSGKLPPG